MEDELAEVKRRIGEAELALKRAEDLCDRDLILKREERLNLLLRDKERLTTGATAAAAPTGAGGSAVGFAMPQPVFTLKLKVPFPPVILRKSRSSRGSIHGSTIVTGGDEDEKETMRIWFSQALAKTTHFNLLKPVPDEREASASWIFSDYKEAIEDLDLGFKVWDIQNTTGDTISVVLEDSNGLQKELSGRADFIVSSSNARCQGAALQHAVCVVEIQSNVNEQDCEFQLVAYLVLMMNRFGLGRLVGILVYNNGTCRAYRASRDNNGVVYEQNDTFPLYQIADVLPTLLDF